MKLQVLQENLAKAVGLTLRFTSQKAQLPILGNILLSATKNKLLLASTNLEVSAATTIGAKVEKEGEITVPVKIASELVANLAPGAIALETDKEALKIVSPNFSFEIAGMNSSDFPEVPKYINKKESFPFLVSELENALDKVLFVASIDETRPTLTGVLFLFKKDSLVLVATDGFRLSQKEIKTKGAKTASLDKVILPKSLLGDLDKLSEDEFLDFCYKEKENQVLFGNSQTVFATRIIEGTYPDFEKIIPKEANYKIRVDKEEFLRAVKLASVFARDSANIVKIRLEKDYLGITGTSQSGNQKGRVDAKIEGGKINGDFEIAFNCRFLEEFLHVVEGEEVIIELSDPEKPGVWKDSKDPDFLHLIMPVMVQG